MRTTYNAVFSSVLVEKLQQQTAFHYQAEYICKKLDESLPSFKWILNFTAISPVFGLEHPKIYI